MRSSDNYWMRQMNSSRLSRRRFVGGATAAGAGVAGLALVGCGGDDDDNGNGGNTPSAATNTPASGETPSGGQTPAASPTAAAAEGKQGGVIRYSSANATYDTFDAARSRFTPFATIIGYTMQRIVQWDSFTQGIIGGAFAESWEQPDDLTLTFKLRPNNFFHDKAPVNGRATSVEDMVFHIERNKAGVLQDGTEDPNFYRAPNYQVVNTVEAVDDTTMRITLNAPDPFFLNLLAQSYEGIQAPEAVAEFEGRYSNFSADLIIGSGPLILQDFSAEGRSLFVRNPNFYKDIFIDGIQEIPLFTDPTAQRAAYEQKQIDFYSPSTVPVLEELLDRYDGQIQDRPGFSANPIAGTYYGGSGSVWADKRLVEAIFRAYDRRQLIQQFHGGRGAMSGNIPPTQAAFRIPESELITYPGYLEDRDAEITEARALWEAGGGPALGTITFDVPDIFEGLYGAASILIPMLNTNLGIDQFEATVEPYTTITSKIIQQQYGGGGNANIWYGWITELTDPEPSAGIISNFDSSSPLFQQYGVEMPEVDALIPQLAAELDVEARQEITKDVERILLANFGAGIPYSHVQITNSLSWNYVHPIERSPFSTAHLTAADTWIDPDDATYQGRAPDPDIG